MSEAVVSDQASETAASAAAPLSAGQLIRRAREASGMHIAALSVALKVPVRKLELLEADAYDQLPGSTFTRALAKSVCRALKVDATPVLALLPVRQDAGLDHAVIGGARREAFANPAAAHKASQALPQPMVVAGVGLVLLAALVYLLPPISLDGWTNPDTTEAPKQVTQASSADAPQAATAITPVADSTPVVGSVGAAPVVAAPPPGTVQAASQGVAAPGAEAADAPLQLKSTAPSWVEVRDAAGTVVYTGTVTPGVPASVQMKGTGQLTVGNAAATEVLWRGRQLDAAAAARDNVARLELK